MQNLIKYLDWDSKILGCSVYKIESICTSEAMVNECIKSINNGHKKLIYFSCAHPIMLGNMVDKKTFLHANLGQKNLKDHFPDKNIMLYESQEPCKDLISLSILSGRFSRFNVDSNINQTQFEKIFTLWIQNSTKSDVIFTYSVENKIVGFISTLISNNVGHIRLISVSDNYSRRGIGGKLIEKSLRYFKDNNCLTACVVTQGANKPALNLYSSHGFTISKIEYFYHWWLQKNPDIFHK